MLRVQVQPAYVLHARSYRESSHLLELLSRDYGRVAVVARGSRGPKSRWKNILQPFRPLLVGWTQRSELGTLTGADQVAAPPALAGGSLYCGLYINELMMRLLHRGDPHPDVFERYRDTLGLLAVGSDPQPALRVFEKHLLEATGFGLLLDREAGGEAQIQADAWYEYRPEQGPVRVSQDALDKAKNRVSASRTVLLRGSSLLSLNSEDLTEDELPALRDLMRRVIRHHLGDKPLGSEALYRAAQHRSRSIKKGSVSD